MKHLSLVVFCYFILCNICIAQQNKYVKQIDAKAIYFTDADTMRFKSDPKDTIQNLFFIFEAEQDTIGLDPGLNTDGRWRAIHLAKIFQRYPLGKVVTTPFRKGVLTLQPLTDQSKYKLFYYDQSELRALYNNIQNVWPRPCLIIIHKETFAEIVKHYTKNTLKENIAAEPSDRLFLISRSKIKSEFFSFKYNIR